MTAALTRSFLAHRQICSFCTMCPRRRNNRDSSAAAEDALRQDPARHHQEDRRRRQMDHAGDHRRPGDFGRDHRRAEGARGGGIGLSAGHSGARAKPANPESRAIAIANMEPQDIQGKKFPGYGRCIFCGCKGDKDGLRNEHIIPFSLGGKAEIENATCKQCEGITSYLDGYLARHTYGEYRVHAGAPTRNPKERPSEFPARIVVAGEEEIRSFAI